MPTKLHDHIVVLLAYFLVGWARVHGGAVLGYASIGVPEYWIVDPDERSVERLVLRDGCLLAVETQRADAHFAPPSFPGLEVPLGELWTLPA